MRRIGRVLLGMAMLTALSAPVSASVASSVYAAAPSYAATPSPAVAVEQLCGPAAPGFAQCLALTRIDIAPSLASAVTPGFVPGGYGPADIQSAYSLPSGSAGAGRTVAVVDAFDLPTAEADLAAYRAQYGLPVCTTTNGCFKKVNQTGGTTYPVADANWGGEIALDIDMVSAACPNCKILLVEANTNLTADLVIAENTAVSLGAVAVSNSWGSPEFGAETSLDSYFDHPGVAITASTGDCGYGSYQGTTCVTGNIEWPAANPNVVAVGGTSLVKDGSLRGWTESAWGSGTSGAGSGCSLYEAKPSWQKDLDCANRMEADVSAVADPYTGVAIYDTDLGGWRVFGGTSAASPIIASVYALAGAPKAGTYPVGYPYADTGALNDVTSGTADIQGICPKAHPYYFCDGVVGYDGPTGLGTPKGVGAFSFSHATPPGKPTSAHAVAGNTTAFVSWHAPAANGGSAITGYTVRANPGPRTCTTLGTLSCTVTGLTNGQSYYFTVTAANATSAGPASDPSNSVVPQAPWTVTLAASATKVNINAAATLTATANQSVTAFGYSLFIVSGNGSTITSCDTGKTCSVSVANSGVVSVAYHAIVGVSTVDPPVATSAAVTVVWGNLPGAPTNLNALAGNASAMVSWDPAVVPIGPPVTSYTATSAPGGKTCVWKSPLTAQNPLQCNVLGLTNGQPYTFTVTATNPRGTGPASQATYSVIPATIPGAPTGVNAAAGHTYASVWWAAAAGNGATVIAYTVTASPGGQTCTNSGTLSCTVTGLTEGRSYTFTVRAANGIGTGPASAPSAAVLIGWPAAHYYPISPRRVLDTRATVATGNPTNIGLAGVFKAGTVRTFAIAGARYVSGGAALAVPSTAVAVTGNVTITGETAAGVLALGPTMSATGAVTTINFAKGDTRANNVTVGLAPDGSLQAVYRATGGATTNVIFDVTGYFLPGTGGATYHPLAPGRILDTRPTGGGVTHIGPFYKLPNRTVKTFPIAGVKALGWSSALVPASAVGVTGNVTVTNATSKGYVAIGPTMTTTPSTSTANVAAGSNVANGVTVALSGGKLSIVWCGTVGSSADVIFDVTGFFTADASGLSYHAINPVRLLSAGSFASRIARTTGIGGIGAIPADARGISGNLTVTSPTTVGWALVSPEIVAAPATSTVNANPGQSIANGFDVALGTSAHVALEWAGKTGSTARLSLDVTGYWK